MHFSLKLPPPIRIPPIHIPPIKLPAPIKLAPVNMSALKQSIGIIAGAILLNPIGKMLVMASTGIADAATKGKATEFLNDGKKTNSTLDMLPGGMLLQKITNSATHGQSGNTLSKIIPDPKKIVINQVTKVVEEKKTIHQVIAKIIPPPLKQQITSIPISSVIPQKKNMHEIISNIITKPNIPALVSNSIIKNENQVPVPVPIQLSVLPPIKITNPVQVPVLIQLPVPFPVPHPIPVSIPVPVSNTLSALSVPIPIPVSNIPNPSNIILPVSNNIPNSNTNSILPISLGILALFVLFLK